MNSANAVGKDSCSAVGCRHGTGTDNNHYQETVVERVTDDGAASVRLKHCWLRQTNERQWRQIACGQRDAIHLREKGISIC
jgi:hypothetical protein